MADSFDRCSERATCQEGLNCSHGARLHRGGQDGGHAHTRKRPNLRRGRDSRGEGEIKALLVWRRSEKVVALQQEPGADFGLRDVGVGWGEMGQGLRKGRTWANTCLTPK